MIKSVKKKVGQIACRGLNADGTDCGTLVPVWKDSNTGALSYSCLECRCGSYAKNDGSPNYRGVLARAQASNAPGEKTPEKKPFSVFG